MVNQVKIVAKVATTPEFLVAKKKVLVALVTVLVPISSPVDSGHELGKAVPKAIQTFMTEVETMLVK